MIKYLPQAVVYDTALLLAMKTTTESDFFKEFKAHVLARSDFAEWQNEWRDCATLTFPAKLPEIGSIIVYDDNHELTLAVGKIYHTHFNPEFGPTFDRAVISAPVHIAIETLKFIDDILSDSMVFWILYYHNNPVAFGVCPKSEIDDVPSDAVCYTWSGVYKKWYDCHCSNFIGLYNILTFPLLNNICLTL